MATAQHFRWALLRASGRRPGNRSRCPPTSLRDVQTLAMGSRPHGRCRSTIFSRGWCLDHRPRQTASSGVHMNHEQRLALILKPFSSEPSLRAMADADRERQRVRIRLWLRAWRAKFPELNLAVNRAWRAKNAKHVREIPPMATLQPGQGEALRGASAGQAEGRSAMMLAVWNLEPDGRVGRRRRRKARRLGRFDRHPGRAVSWRHTDCVSSIPIFPVPIAETARATSGEAGGADTWTLMTTWATSSQVISW